MVKTTKDLHRREAEQMAADAALAKTQRQHGSEVASALAAIVKVGVHEGGNGSPDAPTGKAGANSNPNPSPNPKANPKARGGVHSPSDGSQTAAEDGDESDMASIGFGSSSFSMSPKSSPDRRMLSPPHSVSRALGGSGGGATSSSSRQRQQQLLRGVSDDPEFFAVRSGPLGSSPNRVVVLSDSPGKRIPGYSSGGGGYQDSSNDAGAEDDDEDDDSDHGSDPGMVLHRLRGGHTGRRHQQLQARRSRNRNRNRNGNSPNRVGNARQQQQQQQPRHGNPKRNTRNRPRSSSDAVALNQWNKADGALLLRSTLGRPKSYDQLSPSSGSGTGTGTGKHTSQQDLPPIAIPEAVKKARRSPNKGKGTNHQRRTGNTGIGIGIQKPKKLSPSAAGGRFLSLSPSKRNAQKKKKKKTKLSSLRSPDRDRDRRSSRHSNGSGNGNGNGTGNGDDDSDTDTHTPRLHDKRLLSTMRHLVDHSAITKQFGTPVHAHAHEDKVSASRSHARLLRIHSLQMRVQEELEGLQHRL